MAEYICREDVLDNSNIITVQTKEYGSIEVIPVDTIADIELANVQPVKHGRWIEKSPYKDETVKGLEFQIVCSECDEQNCSLEFDENYNAIGKTFYRTRYCPTCGAKMDLE